MIEIKDLTKYYGNHCAVDHLNTTFHDGGIYGFLGPNGAGKSTAMNMITGCLSPTEGDALIDGHSIRTEPEKAKRLVGYLPEQPPLYVDMTVDEYLLFVTELKHIPRAQRKGQVEYAENLTGLSEMRHRLVRNLSKGYRQRVGVAQAILGEPTMLILDEPTVGLDPQQIIEIRELIRTLAKTQTIILSSHILSEVQAVCDHVLIINHGKLIADDTMEHLERDLLGDETLLLDLHASEAQTRQLLADLTGIGKATLSQEGEITHAVVPCLHGADPREQVFRACVKADCAILGMQFEQASLEKVFLRLTQGTND